MTHLLLERLGLLLHLDTRVLAGVIERLGWTLLHSTWQFGVLAGGLLLARQLLARCFPAQYQAQARYLSSTISLAIMPCIALLTFALTSPAEGISRDDVPLAAMPQIGSSAAGNSPAEIGAATPSPSAFPGDVEGSTRRIEIDDLRDSGMVPAASGELEQGQAASPLLADLHTTHWLDRIRQAAEPWLGPIVIFWLLGVVLISLRPAVGLWAVRHLRRNGISPVSPAIHEIVARLAGQLGVRRTVAVVQSALVEVPAVIGWLRPVILLPVSIVMAIDPAQLEAILAHELAHLRRHDYLVNLGQMFVETLFFYHPAVWWISNGMRAEREDCCDDFVVRLLGNRTTYARALVAVDELRGSFAGPASNAAPLATVLSATGGALMKRVQRIMGAPRERQSGWILTPLVLGLCLASVVWLSIGNPGGARQVASAGAAPDEPPAAAGGPAILKLLNAQDESIGGHVNLARIGFGPGIEKLASWEGNKPGGIELSGLGAGTHTLVANSDAPNATVFTVKIPTTDSQALRQRIVPLHGWYSRRNIETPAAEVSVADRGSHGVIEVVLTNRSDNPFNFTAADFRLSTETLRVLLPEALHQGGKTIKPHSTQKLRFDWAEIVSQGIWLSRFGEDTSGPAMPPSAEGKMNFWLTSGISRTLPITLIDPAVVLADLARPVPADEARAALSGRILFEGTRPAPKRITYPAPDLEAWARDGKRANSPHRPSVPQTLFHENYRDVEIVDESLVVGPNAGFANVLIWLRPLDPNRKVKLPDRPPGNDSVTLEIGKGRFAPHLLALGTWQSLQVRNADRALINIVATPMLNAGFNRLMKPDESFAVSLEAEKRPFKLQSNIAPWMSAYVLPLDHPYFAVTRDDGNFRIEKIPPGEWELVFWHEVCGWLPLQEYPKGREKLAIAAGQISLGDLHVQAATLALESPPVRQAKTPEKGPRELPLGNFGGIPQRDQLPQKSPAPIAPDAGDAGWIDAEFGLQYRLRMPDAKIVGTAVGEGRLTVTPQELPLLYVDLRNVGDRAQNLQFDLGIETHQSRHEVVVDGVTYERRDQPWGGLDSLSPAGGTITLPFILSEDWKSQTAQAALGNKDVEPGTGLKLAEGVHRVSVQLHFHEFAYEPGDDPEGPPRKTLRARGGSRALVTQPFLLAVAPSRAAEPPSVELVALDNIRRELVGFPRIHVPRVTTSLRRLVLENQPAAGDLLIGRVGDGNDQEVDPASSIVAELWKSFSRDQLERYLKAQMTHFIQQRAAYPAGVDAAIAVGPRFRGGYPGLPKEPAVKSETVTTHFLDGQPIGEPFKYPLHTSISRWIRTADLAVGRHTIRVVTDYKFDAGELSFTGRVESPEFGFEIQPAETPDELLVRPTAALERRFREALLIREVADNYEPPGRASELETRQPGRKLVSTWGPGGWAPQIRGGGKDGKAGSLHMPAWQLFDPLPVDLCFRTEFSLEGTDVVIPGTELVVFSGETRAFYFYPQTLNFDLLRKHADKEGFIPARVRLIPSRATALSHPRVTRYYGGEFVSDVVRLRVDHDPKARETQKD